MNNRQNEITAERKRLFIDNIANHTRLSVLAIEKDWWVTMVLNALFQTSCADYLVFKGLCADLHKPFYVQQIIMYSNRS